MKRLFYFFCIWVFFSCQKDDSGGTPVVNTPVLAPTAATLKSPGDKTLCLAGNPLNSTYTELTLEWTATQNTEYYDVVITNLFTNSSQTKRSSQPNLTIILEAGTPYSWMVQSKSNKSTETGNSPVWKFYLAGNGKTNLAPFPADNLIPASGKSVALISDKTTLSWVGSDADSNTLTYEVFIDTDSKKVLNHEINPIQAQGNTSLSVTLKSGQIYYWQVKTSDGELSSFTQVFSFRTI